MAPRDPVAGEPGRGSARHELRGRPLKPRCTLVGLELPDASLKLDPKPSALSSVKAAGDAGIVIPVGAYRFRNLRASYTLGPQRRIAGDVILARGGLFTGDRTELGYRGRAEVSSRLSIEPGLTVN